MKRITCFISRNFPTMKKHVIPSSTTTPLGINNKHPMKRKHRHKKHAAKHLFFNKVVSYLVSDSHMYNPLVSPQPSFDFPPPKHMFTSSSAGKFYFYGIMEVHMIFYYFISCIYNIFYNFV
ncbi:hypothetical protein Hanom_Chr00s062333g01785561 [Helianthus anomalus]